MHSRICLLCASLLMGVSVYGQSLKINEVDKFSKEKKVYTSFEKISSESVMMVSPIGKNIWLRFAHDHGLDFAQLRWCSKEVLSVDSDADIVFLDKDGNTYNFKNKDYTLSTPGGGAVVAIRIYTNDGYYDFDIKEKNAKKLIKTYSLFEKALKK